MIDIETIELIQEENKELYIKANEDGTITIDGTLTVKQLGLIHDMLCNADDKITINNLKNNQQEGK